MLVFWYGNSLKKEGVKMKEKIRELFDKKGLPPGEKLRDMLRKPLKSAADFSEIFVQNSTHKSYRLSERLISNISNTYSSGAGIRVVKGNNTGYSYTEDLTGKSIGKCIADAVEIAGSGKTLAVSGYDGSHNLYDTPSAVSEDPAVIVDLLRRAEAKAFATSSLVEKVEVFLTVSENSVLILNSTGAEAYDRRPMITFGVSVIVNKDNVREGAYEGGGGRTGLSYFDIVSPEELAEKAVKQGLLLLDARPAPAGEMEVVLGAGESGILLHESIGHPLEADFNYRGSSAFSGQIGKKVASDQCTIIDQGDWPGERGSLNVDDEGNRTGKTVLIENGILKTYMYDLITANHYKTTSYNGRRESFREIPLPRMTNTYMLAGKYSHDEIIKSVKKGIYAKGFSGGQVDISCGDFVFSITEGYKIENGRITEPIKGATLIGNGPEILKRVEMVGSDMVVSDGKWTCGKDGQSVPVGVGIPTVKLSHITVGGTQNG
jgi:TldD protein